MIETWVLIFWLSNCIGEDCPIENWMALEQPSRSACETNRQAIIKDWEGKLKTIKDIKPQAVCVWGKLNELEPE